MFILSLFRHTSEKTATVECAEVRDALFSCLRRNNVKGALGITKGEAVQEDTNAAALRTASP
jgi:hypothetical protein